MISSSFSFRGGRNGGGESEADLAEGEGHCLRLSHLVAVIGDEGLDLALQAGDAVLVGLALFLGDLLSSDDLLLHITLDVVDRDGRLGDLTEGVVHVLPGFEARGLDHSFSCHWLGSFLCSLFGRALAEGVVTGKE